MSRAYNFGAGPATLPESLLQQAADEMLDWQGCGMSVMEISHRSAEFKALIASAERDLRELLSIPDDYEVLFLGSPARAHFAMIPMNCSRGREHALYLSSGIWSELAASEAQKFTQVTRVANYQECSLDELFDASRWPTVNDAAYFYLCQNETISGVAVDKLPKLDNIPIIADMTSCLLSEAIDVSAYGCIFAGAQKNIGPAGASVVIVRRDLLHDIPDTVPSVFNYRLQADADSLFATPPSFNIYMMGLMFRWIKAQGGLQAMAELNQAKAEKLYASIDDSDFYTNTVDVAYRSKMNVTFTLEAPDLNQTFLKQAQAQGLLALKGHRSVGGMRASLYNAMSMAGVDALCEFMSDFAREHS